MPPRPRAQVVSHAQNAEDVRLWRVFGERPAGFYVDVGAGDPEVDSVTRLFYEAGWSGINIEPGPDFESLARMRPRDTNLRIAIAEQPGRAEMWISSPHTGLSGFTPLPRELLPPGFSLKRVKVDCRRLDDVLSAHAPGRTVDFLKVDVEGAEGQVLASLDLRQVRPSVICVEAVAPISNAPSHHAWEEMLLDAGFLFAAFDGVNRFYVPVELADLRPALAYPISVLDDYVRAGSGAPGTGPEISRLRAENARLAERLALVHRTVSWRVTRPLRVVRRLIQRKARTLRGDG